MPRRNTLIPIAFVDDHTSFRNYLSFYLEQLPNNFKIYHYDDGKDFVTRFPTENYEPAIVLMDVRMPNLNGYDTTTWIKQHYPTIPVLVFSEIIDSLAIVSLVRCGANGHSNKGDCYPPTRLLEAMEKVMAGELYFDEPELYTFVKKSLATPKEELKKGFDSLTNREMAVIRCILIQKSIKESAKELYLSEDGYKSRRKSIFKKLGVHSIDALLEFAKKMGLR